MPTTATGSSSNDTDVGATCSRHPALPARYSRSWTFPLLTPFSVPVFWAWGSAAIAHPHPAFYYPAYRRVGHSCCCCCCGRRLIGGHVCRLLTSHPPPPVRVCRRCSQLVVFDSCPYPTWYSNSSSYSRPKPVSTCASLLLILWTIR